MDGIFWEGGAPLGPPPRSPGRLATNVHRQDSRHCSDHIMNGPSTSTPHFLYYHSPWSGVKPPKMAMQAAIGIGS
jgi:hypothetical protein